MSDKILHRCGFASQEIYDRMFECIQEEESSLVFKLKATNSYYCETFVVLYCPFCGYKDPLPNAEENAKREYAKHKSLIDLPTYEEIKVMQQRHPFDEELCIEELIKDKYR